MQNNLKVATQIFDIPSGNKQRKFAWILSLFIIIVSMAVIPFGKEMLPDIHPFLPAIISWFVFGDLITGYILFSQYRASGTIPLLVLSCTYLYMGLIAIPYALTFPGVISEAGLLGNGGQTSVWLWVFWHGGFPTGIIIYLITGLVWKDPLISKQRINKYGLMAVGGSILSVFIVFALVTLGSGWFPNIISKGNYSKLISSGVGPVIWILNVMALMLIIIKYQGRSVLNLWVSVAILACTLDVTLTLFAGARFSLGWYLARVNSILAGTVVFYSIVNEVNRLFIRLSEQHRKLSESERQLEEANEELTRLSNLDGLTGIPNRRQMDEVLSKELESSEERSLSLLLLDVDYFKQYNDYYGHLGGDHILKTIAQTIYADVKPFRGFVARYGGEEFAVVLTNLDAIGTLLIAERIREGIVELNIPHEACIASDRVTISIGGYVVAPHESIDGDELIRKADESLYRAKDEGRNRSIVNGWYDGYSDFEI
ncbi:sensor domain-containing diguanylate cyclase [Paenibacillus anaericanus]|uniref:sensor domain-containing diguanylate cyclase n=1 Tax=Paenibacillus anaericanus TaxID=170367 RepID=UPI0014776CF5|nr:MASE4 domain-containing protein [Paenibacillus anaericanus]